MSTQAAYMSTNPQHMTSTHASFIGIMRGEFLKIARLFCFLLLLLTVGFLLSFLLLYSSPGAASDLHHTPLHFFYSMMESNLAAFRIMVGIVLLILTSYTIGRDYQYGTIRILLARGTGRIQLLLAKSALLALLALALVILFSLLTALLICLAIILLAGNLDAISSLTPAFWSHTEICLSAVMISMGATVLLAVAMNAFGRSLTIGLSASLAWFAIDNMGVLLMGLLARLTQSTLWANATSYFLGPLLNRLPELLLPKQAQNGFDAIGPAPLVSTSGSHALWVIFTYMLVFCILAVVPTWKRDVKE
ncbi:ABC transporter permease [Dictyobacter kobayashii]|uniref:Uncharacterized protein n=1 Tax=Dictyobacter kobayashii TaxID=2014872 RepID=A0A402AZB8_9CHLR|nr:ABC transporter permease [Dictyobacter kobayashii]GCE24474.1 hypothetical protein KDK_82740 [Dictyobacter kobayashii]